MIKFNNDEIVSIKYQGNDILSVLFLNLEVYSSGFRWKTLLPMRMCAENNWVFEYLPQNVYDHEIYDNYHLEYKINDDEWSEYENPVSVPANLWISFRGYIENINGYAPLSPIGRFRSQNDEPFTVNGDLMSLVNGEMTPGAFVSLFEESAVKEAQGLSITTTDFKSHMKMFKNCLLLEHIPISVQYCNLSRQCFEEMFYGCINLSTICLELTEVPDDCFTSMFEGCTSLTTADIRATYVGSHAMYRMFTGCINLGYVIINKPIIYDYHNYTGWLDGVKDEGIINIKYNPDSDMHALCQGDSGVPYGWQVSIHDSDDYIDTVKFTEVPEYSLSTDECVTIRAVAGHTYSYIGTTQIAQDADIYISDDRIHWNKFYPGRLFQLANGVDYFIYGLANSNFDNPTSPNDTRYSESRYITRFVFFGGWFEMSGNYNNLFKNINRYGAARCMFQNCINLKQASGSLSGSLYWNLFDRMFCDCSNLTTAPDLLSTTATRECYFCMFMNCINLTAAPIISATNTAENCCGYMFSNCYSLITAPLLLGDIAYDRCYLNMFRYCSSLTTAPQILPATTVCSDCYEYMFYGCTSLTTAPELPATVLNSGCYDYMFYNCSSLNYVKALFTSTNDVYNNPCTSQWLYGVSASGTFVKSSYATSIPIGWDGGIPNGWTIETAST